MRKSFYLDHNNFFQFNVKLEKEDFTDFSFLLNDDCSYISSINISIQKNILASSIKAACSNKNSIKYLVLNGLVTINISDSDDNVIDEILSYPCITNPKNSECYLSVFLTHNNNIKIIDTRNFVPFDLVDILTEFNFD